MKIQINLIDFDTKSFDPIAPGFYEAEVVDVNLDQASTGTRFLNVEFEVLGPKEVGRHVWGKFYLTDKAGWKLAALLNAVHIPVADDLETDHLVGKKLLIRIKEVEDQDSNLRTEAVAFRRLKVEKVPF